MKILLLTTFILVGVVDSKDSQFATVELDLNPATNAGPAVAIMPLSAFPCKIEEGDKFFVVKLLADQDAVVQCAEKHLNRR
jgi:hypothetical protein